MRVILLLIGNRMPGWVNTGTEEYSKRLAGDIRLELDEIAMPRRDGRPVAQLIDREAELLEKRLQKYPGAYRVALEVRGKRLDTPALAKRLGRFRDEGRDMVLLVGGPDGLSPALSASCDERWSLSDLTLPHPLVRILLAEQIYRGWSLLTGHPYHR